MSTKGIILTVLFLGMNVNFMFSGNITNQESETNTPVTEQVYEDWNWEYWSQYVDSCNWYFDVGNRVAKLSQCSKRALDIVIPETVTYNDVEYTVVALSCNFNNATQSVQLPKTLRYIASGALKNLSITSITIPENVYFIGDDVFYNCDALQSIELPSSLLNIGNSFCYDCDALQSVELPSSLLSIGYSFCYDCDALQNVDLQLSSSLLSVGHNFCYDCDALQSVDLPSSLQSISNSFCYDCDALKELTIPDSVKTIGDYVLLRCDALEQVQLPEALESIGREFCYDTKSLKALTLPAGLKAIDDYFLYGSALTEITSLAAEPPVIDYGISGNIRIVNVPQGCYAAYADAAYWKNMAIVDGSGVDVTVNLPEAGKLGEEILKQVEYIKYVNRLTISGALNDDDFYHIKNNMPNLIEIDMSDVEMTDFPKDLFYDRYALKRVKLPKTLKTIGNSAFYRCYLLNHVEIPEGVTSIGSGAFYECSALDDITLSKDLKSIGSSAFYRTALKQIALPEGLENINSYAFQSSALTSITVPGSVKKIYDYAFENCSQLTSVTLNEGISILGDGAFEETPITTITLPSTIKECYAPFDYCQKLKEVYVQALIPPFLTNDYNLLGSKDLAKTCALYVPALSVNTYKLKKGWENFGTIEPISEYFLPENIVVHEPVELTLPDALNAAYKPNVSFTCIQSTYYQQYGSVVLKGNATLSVGNFSMWVDPSYYKSYKNNSVCYNALVNEANMRADNITYYVYMRQNEWNFLSFPFDVKVSDIVPEFENTNYVIRQYSGAARAAQAFDETWLNMTPDSTLRAGVGYIWQCNNSTSNTNYCGFVVTAVNNANKNLLFANEARTVALDEYQSEFSHNRSWNLIGNPYPCFYDTRMMDFEAPITVWNDNNRTYEAYSPIDDAYILRPAEAFFVQRPVDAEAITFNTEGRQVNQTVVERAATQGIAAEKAIRKVFNLCLSNGELTDKTRFVLNNEASSAYESHRDASKFMSSDASVSQLYSIEQGVDMAINERPMNDGTVVLGAYFAKDGEYTISLNTTASEIVTLIDHATGMHTVLNNSSYTFNANKGVDRARFTLKIGLNPTGINNATSKTFSVSVQSGQIIVDGAAGESVALYTIEGKCIAETKQTPAVFNVATGVYLVKVGQMTQKVVVQ